MRDAALLARDKGVMLHTHLAEDEDDVAFSLERFGCRPGVYAERLGWTGRDVWMAHCVKLDADEIALFAATGTGVAHCPCSNCRLGSGIAPLTHMLAAGVPLGLGVDGSASNDSGNLLQEARQSLLLQRVVHAAESFAPRTALRLATRGGAEMLGRHDCGALIVGRRADLAVWDVGEAANSGAWDVVAGLVLCPPAGVRDLFVEGRPIVSGRQLSSASLPAILADARRSVTRLHDG